MDAWETMWVVFVATFAGLVGLLIGSFLNVVVYRVPAGKSIVHPPSSCPNCGATIRPWDNIPVVSWLVLRGRCRDCKTPISKRYPLVELATGVLFAVIGAWLAPAIAASTDYESPTVAIAALLQLIAFLYLAAISIALFLIDLDTKRLPNVIVLPAYVVGVVLLGTSALLLGLLPDFLIALVSAAAMFVFYLILALVKPGGMGFGDVKLAGVIGLFLGWIGVGSVVVGLFSAFLLGGLFSIGLLVLRKAGRKSGIPFGPWMLIGAWVGVFFGEQIAGAYLALIGFN